MSTITPKFGDKSSNGSRVIAIFRFSKWRPAAILNFVVAPKWRHGMLRTVRSYQHTKFGEYISKTAEKWRFSIFQDGGRLDFHTGKKLCYGTLLTVHVYQHAKLGDNISNGGRVIAIFLFFKMAAGRHLGFCCSPKWRHGALRTVRRYTHTKFGEDISKNCWDFGDFPFFKMAVCAFCGKVENGDVRHFEFVFGNSGPPTKLAYGPEVAQKIWCQSNFYFSRYHDVKILKIYLKTPIQAPKIYDFGVLTPQCYFSLLTPPKGTSLAGNTPFEPSTVAVRRAERSGRWAKNAKKYKIEGARERAYLRQVNF